MLKQPKALSVFFMTEMWERYGFNAIELLLILYLIQVFHLPDTFSYGVLGSITALAYVNSVIGGYLADRFIGHRTAVLLGAALLAVFYILISVATSLNFMAWSLSIFTLGTGLLKPNVSSMVGSLYKENDVRRYSGFTIFYIGINLGGILGATIPSYVQQGLGWHVTYLTAMAMMLVAFFTFWAGVRYFHIKDIRNIVYPKKNWGPAILIMLITLGFSYFIIKHQKVALLAFFAIALISAGIVIYEAFHEKGKMRMHIVAYLVLVCLSIVFWALFFQIFFSMNLFVDRVVDHHLWGISLTTSSFAAIEPLGVILIGIFLSWLWTRLQDSWWNPSTPMKFSLGFFMISLVFGLLFISSLLTKSGGLVMPELLILVYLIMAAGELLLSPTGLAMVTELVPQRLMGTMMGIFFISLGLGGKLAGFFADISAIPQNLTDVAQIEHIYRHAFFIYFLICTAAGLVSLMLVPALKKLIASE